MEPSPPLALEALQLDKAFGSTHALKRVSLAVEPGTVHALLGSNGSGKSTLIKVLAGYHQPDSGEVLVNGERVQLGLPAHMLLGVGSCTRTSVSSTLCRFLTTCPWASVIPRDLGQSDARWRRSKLMQCCGW
jgi:ABC-type branched-subunit amino acid transport system ATPase component